jgi:hypothetical protein
MVHDDRLDFVVIHDRDHFFREAVHIAVGTLEAEGRLGAEFVGLRG